MTNSKSERRYCAQTIFDSDLEVKAVAKPTLRHRLVIRPELELEGTTADGVLDGLLASVPAPR
jgi:MoxR-like ATPase